MISLAVFAGAFFFGFPDGFLTSEFPPPSDSFSGSAHRSSSSSFSSPPSQGSTRCFTTFFSSSCSHLALFLRSLSSFLDLLLSTHPEASEHLLIYLQKSPSMAANLAFLVSASPFSAVSSSVLSGSFLPPPFISPSPSPSSRCLWHSSSEGDSPSPPAGRTAFVWHLRKSGREGKEGSEGTSEGEARLGRRFREKNEFLSICTVEAARLLALFSSRDPCFFVREMLPKCLRADEEAFCRVCVQLLPVWADVFEKEKLKDRCCLSSGRGEQELLVSTDRQRTRDLRGEHQNCGENRHREEERRRWIGALEYLVDLCCNEVSGDRWRSSWT